VVQPPEHQIRRCRRRQCGCQTWTLKGNLHYETGRYSSTHPTHNLGAKDGVLFRVHSFTLKATSLFRSIFSFLPEQSGSVQSVQTENIHINLNEDANTLKYLLRMICGLPVLVIDSCDAIGSLLYAGPARHDPPTPRSARCSMSF
jgi:hypothetical protein